MIKRPINTRFRQAVLSGRKVTTIRDNPWPVGQPLMLYSWTDKPYRSKQDDLCAVIVADYYPITILRGENDDMTYFLTAPPADFNAPIWQTEGFDSAEDMDAWFRPLTKPGKLVEKYLMNFSREGGSHE